jgi:hypothetical protein
LHRFATLLKNTGFFMTIAANGLFAPLRLTPKADPFAKIAAKIHPSPVYVPQSPIQGIRVLYLSGTVELLSLPDGDRLWFGLGSSWYRRLDANAYLWLLDRFWNHFEAQRDSYGEIELSEDVAHLPDQFAFVKREGLAHGSFTVNQVRKRRMPSKSFRWSEGMPKGFDGPYFEMTREALTSEN